MDVPAILHQLTRAEGLPREALKAASAQRAEMVPVLLKEIEQDSGPTLAKERL